LEEDVYARQVLKPASAGGSVWWLGKPIGAVAATGLTTIAALPVVGFGENHEAVFPIEILLGI
jgi:hypothetical protein